MTSDKSVSVIRRINYASIKSSDAPCDGVQQCVGESSFTVGLRRFVARARPSGSGERSRVCFATKVRRRLLFEVHGSIAVELQFVLSGRTFRELVDGDAEHQLYEARAYSFRSCASLRHLSVLLKRVRDIATAPLRLGFLVRAAPTFSRISLGARLRNITG